MLTQDLKLDGRYHALKVALVNPKGLTLQARRGYYAPRYAADPAEQAKRQAEKARLDASQDKNRRS